MLCSIQVFLNCSYSPVVIYGDFAVKLDIDGERLAYRAKKVVHPSEEVVLEEPCVLLDLGGRIIAWVLPGIFSPWREVCLILCLAVYNR